ncbi:hypothetical protein P4B35_08470 [Pontiellaceae bacterium B12227]|nr:hypothetical protein [Pontiellaceae bacterium B12227]
MFKRAIWIIWTAAACAALPTHAETIPAEDWRVTYSFQTADYDRNPENGLERKYTYIVDNLSSPGSYHNMIEITLYAGTNQGVYNARENTGNWQVSIEADKTVFSGNGGYISPVNGNLSFYLYTPANQETAEGTIEALAAGDAGGQIPFESKTTTLPMANFATNGASVAWLKAHGYTNGFDAAALADPDADGFANWQEYRADTVPTNALHFPSIGTASNQLCFATSTNCGYSVKFCTNLVSNHWNNHTNLPGTGGEIQLPAVGTNAARFFRLRIDRTNP